jgi:hypothetical protein
MKKMITAYARGPVPILFGMHESFRPSTRSGKKALAEMCRVDLNKGVVEGPAHAVPELPKSAVTKMRSALQASGGGRLALSAPTPRDVAFPPRARAARARAESDDGDEERDAATETTATVELNKLAGLARLGGECSFMYRYIVRESCSQFDSLPLTSLTIPPVALVTQTSRRRSRASRASTGSPS